jgi:peptide/nickel transport system substrate-binding protein
MRVRTLWLVVAVLAAAVLTFQGPVAVAQQPFRVVVAQERDAEDWDPPVGWQTESEWIELNAYDCLLFRNADHSGFVPGLATRWERINDLTTRFHLRPNVRFHDGTPFTAEDVKFHYERIKAGPRERYIVQPQYQFFNDVIVRDPVTVDIVNDAPNTLMMDLMSQTGCGIVSRSYFQRVSRDVLHRAPMGTGPYRLKEWVKGERVVLEANAQYWGGKPDVDEFVFRVIPEPSTRVAELLTGGVDITYNLVPQEEARIRARPNLRALWAVNDRGWMMFPRIRPNERYKGQPELDRKFATEDARIREAVELAIDKYKLMSLFQPGGAAFRSRLFSPTPEANPDLWGRKANLFNPDRARQLLAEARYNAASQKLVMHAHDVYPSADMARAIAQMLRQVGFNIDLRILDLNTFNGQVYFPRRTQELILLQLGGNTKPFFGLFSFLSAQALGPSGYGGSTRQIDNLINCAFQDVRDNARRINCYHRANQVIADERFVIGLLQTQQLWGINSRLRYTPRIDNHIFGVDFKRAQ